MFCGFPCPTLEDCWRETDSKNHCHPLIQITAGSPYKSLRPAHTNHCGARPPPETAWWVHPLGRLRLVWALTGAVGAWRREGELRAVEKLRKSGGWPVWGGHPSSGLGSLFGRRTAVQVRASTGEGAECCCRTPHVLDAPCPAANHWCCSPQPPSREGSLVRGLMRASSRPWLTSAPNRPQVPRKSCVLSRSWPWARPLPQPKIYPISRRGSSARTEVQQTITQRCISCLLSLPRVTSAQPQMPHSL